WHVAFDAAVLLAGLEADSAGQAATLLLMTCQATGPIVRHALRGANVLMRIMAGSAVQLCVAAASLIAPALAHLLDVRYRRLFFGGLVRAHEDRKEIF